MKKLLASIERGDLGNNREIGVRNRGQSGFLLVGENATQLRREDIRGRDSLKFAQRKEALIMAI
jgi:hypothetical protein